MTAAIHAPGFDRAIVRQIDERILGAERDHRVAIPWAIESGSRAWGFPSPDSDYDCRFVFVRARADYLTPWPRRDVIETPLEGLLDVNGWELGKLIRLMLKGNAVAVEWLQSPIHYRYDPAFRDALLGLAAEHGARDAVRRHYMHLGEAQWRRYPAEGDAPVKKLFYALRPAAALRWLRLHEGARIAPMHFPTLFAESDPPRDLAEVVAALIEAKARTRELGNAPTPEPVRAFIEAEYALAREQLGDSAAARLTPAAKAAAEAVFRTLVERHAPDT